MVTAAYPMHIDLFVTWHKKTGLMYINTPIHITLCISLILFKILEICKLYEISYEKLHKFY